MTSPSAWHPSEYDGDRVVEYERLVEIGGEPVRLSVGQNEHGLWWAEAERTDGTTITVKGSPEEAMDEIDAYAAALARTAVARDEGRV